FWGLGRICIAVNTQRAYCLEYLLPQPLPCSSPSFSYPCRCLCLGFSHITRTVPLLRITRHFSHLGLTEDLTFISSALLVYSDSSEEGDAHGSCACRNTIYGVSTPASRHHKFLLG